MGATFNLNSALFGKRQMIGRVGNLGFREIPLSQYDENKASLLKYSIHYRIPKDEIIDVYSGFEIASHTAEHINLTKCSEKACIKQVETDQLVLGNMFRTEIRGFAYPFGRYNDRILKVLKQCGISYARTVSFAKDFYLPDNLLELPMTSWHIKKDVMKKVQEFINADVEQDQFFLMFAHGYEFDFNTKESNFEKFKRICDLVAGHKNVVCCSTGDAIKAILYSK